MRILFFDEKWLVAHSNFDQHHYSKMDTYGPVKLRTGQANFKRGKKAVYSRHLSDGASRYICTFRC